MKLKRLLFPLLTLLLVLLLIPRAQAEEVATSAKACIIIDESSGRVLLSHNAETPLPMASTTISQTSPGFMKICGVRLLPTPPGVPVTITSPGDSGMKVEM